MRSAQAAEDAVGMCTNQGFWKSGMNAPTRKAATSAMRDRKSAAPISASAMRIHAADALERLPPRTTQPAAARAKEIVRRAENCMGFGTVFCRKF